MDTGDGAAGGGVMAERLCSKEVLAERIIAAREAKGWNRTKLALHSGLTEAALYYIEHALYYPRLETLDMICAALGVTLGEVLQCSE